MGERSWYDSWPGVLALGVFGVALWAQADAPVGVFYDDGIYVALAKALAAGEGYRNIHLPGAPPSVHYPILYPAVLSVLWRLWPAFPDNVVLFRLFDSAALAGAAWVVARHAARWTPRVAQLTMLPAGFLAFPLLTIVGVRLSEPLFLLLAAAAVSVADRKEVTLRAAVGAGVLAALAALTRSIGLAVVGGVLASLWWRGRRREAAVAVIPALVFLTPWFIWVAAHASEVDPRIAANYGTYAQFIDQVGIGAVVAGIDLRGLAPVARLVLPPLPAALWFPLAFGLLGVAVWGAVKSVGRVPALVATLSLYAVVVTLWPFIPDRFIWIILPWIFLLLAAGAADLARRGPLLRGAVLVLALLATAGYLRREVVSLRTRGFAAAAEGIGRSFNLLVPSIAAETPADAVIASSDEALVYLYTGRRAIPNYVFRWDGRSRRPLPDGQVRDYFCGADVTHVVLTGPTASAADIVARLQLRDDVMLRPLFEFTEGPALYRFLCFD
jgi:hypothetical protein